MMFDVLKGAPVGACRVTCIRHSSHVGAARASVRPSPFGDRQHQSLDMVCCTGCKSGHESWDGCRAVSPESAATRL